MRFDPAAIAADAAALAELYGGPGHEGVRIKQLRAVLAEILERSQGC